ncbi:uncharacterized protein AB9W97_021133 isoform 2-T2 [Spinachia spinachia]
MRWEMTSALCVLVVLTGSSLTAGQASALPEVPTQSHAGGSASPELTADPHNEVSQGTSTEATTKTKAAVGSEAAPEAVQTNVPPSAAADNLSTARPARSTAPPPRGSTADGRAIVTMDPFSTFSSLSAHTEQDTSSTGRASTFQPQSGSWATASAQSPTAGRPVTSAPGRGAAGQTYQEVPPELNVGDEDLKGPRPSSPLDPLLAGLLSVFIVTTAIVFVILFLKFRQRTNHPEFHRLQDLPMDDLMEDTPLSRYTY